MNLAKVKEFDFLLQWQVLAFQFGRTGYLANIRKAKSFQLLPLKWF
jgi:hypothetical protein